MNPTAAYAGVREGQWSIAQTVDASHAEGATGDYALSILELNGYGAALHSVEIKYAGHTAEEQATIRILGMERISGTDYRYRELIATSPEFTMATGAGVQTRVISFTPSPVLRMADYEYYAFVVHMEGTGQDPRLTYNAADPEAETPPLNLWEHRASLQPNVTPLAIGNNLYGAADPVSLSIDYTLLWPVSGVRVADPTVVSDGVVDHIGGVHGGRHDDPHLRADEQPVRPRNILHGGRWWRREHAACDPTERHHGRRRRDGARRARRRCLGDRGNRHGRGAALSCSPSRIGCSPARRSALPTRATCSCFAMTLTGPRRPN